MKLWKKIRKVHIITALAIIIYSAVLVNVVQAVTAASAEPGSEENPLVAQDYVDSKVGELNAKMDALIKQNEELKKQVEAQEKGSKFEAVMIKAGKQVVAGASTEIVIRSGSAVAVASELGGLSDLISGIDILNDVKIPLNHLVLVPRDDGRGFKAKTDVWILIKGAYTVK